MLRVTNIITSLILLAALFNGADLATGDPVGEPCPRQGGTPVVSKVTMTGEIACLPKKGPGPHTMECAIGLKGADGRYYALKNLFEHDPEHKLSGGGARVEVSGSILGPEEMEGPAASMYDIAGVIVITAIRVLSE